MGVVAGADANGVGFASGSGCGAFCVGVVVGSGVSVGAGAIGEVAALEVSVGGSWATVATGSLRGWWGAGWFGNVVAAAGGGVNGAGNGSRGLLLV